MLTRPLCDSQQTTDLLVVVAGSCFGGYSGGETPGLIPNPEAKPFSADGTALGRVWESRTPPDNFPNGATNGGPVRRLTVRRLARLGSNRCAPVGPWIFGLSLCRRRLTAHTMIATTIAPSA